MSRTRRLTLLQLFFGLALSFQFRLLATPITIDFEGLADSTILTNQYTGLTFANAIILTSGVALNEFEFPPHSGSNVVSDNGGAISITFSSPVPSVSGYFTYAEPLTLEAFSGSNTVATANSSFSNNMALSGDPGSSPNQLLTLSCVCGITSVTFTGDQAGSSFTLDDLTFTPANTSVPEPESISLTVVGVLAIAGLRRKTCMKTIIITGVLGAILLLVGSMSLIAQPQSTDQLAPLRSYQPRSPTAATTRDEVRPSPTATNPVVETPSTTPDFILVNTPTAVIVTVRIEDSTLIPGSVNLLRLGPTGTQPTILGVMHDDGLNGDATPGDGVFTLDILLNETSAGQVSLQVSAAFKGLLKRILSPIFPLSVWLTIHDPNSTLTTAYPANWFARQTSTGFILTSLRNPGPLSDQTLTTYGNFEIETLANANPSSLSIDQWFQAASHDGFSSNPLTITYTTVSGRQAVRITTAELGQWTHLYIQSGTNIIHVAYGPDSDILRSDYEQILFSVHFAQ